MINIKNKMIYFVTFGNNLYVNSLKRIENEAKEMNIFDFIFCYTPKDFDSDFLSKHLHFIKFNKRGYGYWIWKSYFVKKTLEKMNDGDILLYADSGCRLNKNGLPLFKNYIETLNRDNNMISFSIRNTLEKCFTKMDTFNYFQFKDYQHMETEQLMGGIFLLKKNKKTVSLINEWYELCQNYHLIDDSQSISKNDNGFIDHRHDQSIFSLLRKKYNISIVYPDNSYIDGKNWDNDAFIWATRLRF